MSENGIVGWMDCRNDVCRGVLEDSGGKTVAQRVQRVQRALRVQGGQSREWREGNKLISGVESLQSAQI